MMAPASYAGEPERGPMSILSSCRWLEIAMDFMIHRLLQHRTKRRMLLHRTYSVALAQ